MRSPPLTLAILLLVLTLGSTATAETRPANGLVSFGACCSGTTGIYVIHPDGTGERRIYAPEFDDESLVSAWSPRGKRIAYVAPGGLWTMAVNGQRRKRLTKGNGDTLAPTWSPDGKRIAYVDLAVENGSNYALFVIRTTGKGRKRIVRGAQYQNNPAWSPDGKLIMFERGDYLWTVKPTGRGQKRIGVGMSASWSPDGENVAFDKNGSVWVMKANGTDAHLVAQVPSSTAGIAWSPDGKWIAYAIADRGDVMLVRPDGSDEHALTDEPDVFHSEPAWQPKP